MIRSKRIFYPIAGVVISTVVVLGMQFICNKAPGELRYLNKRGERAKYRMMIHVVCRTSEGDSILQSVDWTLRGELKEYVKSIGKKSGVAQVEYSFSGGKLSFLNSEGEGGVFRLPATKIVCKRNSFSTLRKMVSRRGKGVKEEKDLASLFERTFVPDFLEPPLSQEKKRKWRWFRSLREGERWKKSVPVIIPFLEEEVSLPGRYHVENIEIRKKTVDIKGEYEKRIATREGLGFTSSDGIVFYLRGGISGVSRSKFDYRLGRVLASSAKINAQFRYADFPLDKEKSDAGGKRRTSISKPVERGRDILKIAMQILQTVFLPVPARAQEGRWIFVDGRKPTEEKKETLSENGTKGSEAPTGRSAKEDEFLAQYDVFFEDETDKVLEDTGVFQEEGSNDTSKAEQYGGSGFRPEVEIYFDEDEVSPLLRAMIEIQYEFRRVGK